MNLRPGATPALTYYRDEGAESHLKERPQRALPRRSPKRGAAERQGVHAWLPYYAGYSQAFVEESLDYLDLQRGATLLDPMNGSGTTTVTAQLWGVNSIGCDLNPAVAILARAKDAHFASIERDLGEHVGAVLRSAVTLARDRERVPREFSPWMGPSLFTQLSSVRGAILSCEKDLTASAPLARLLRQGEPVVGAGMRTFLMAVLLVTARSLCRILQGSNPSWIRPAAQARADQQRVHAAFRETAAVMWKQLSARFADDAGIRHSRQLVIGASATRLPIRTGAIDGIITSPPYLTRLDYAMATYPELITLGLAPSEVQALRHDLMGGPLACRGPAPTLGPEFRGTCRSVLNAVRQHPSKASSGYYYKTYASYFQRARQVVREWLRVLKSDGRAIIVVQDSWYKDVQIPLADIYCDFARELGGAGEQIMECEVASPLANLNTATARYGRGAVSERVICITKAPSGATRKLRQV